jgi:hypothetical protein
MFWQAIPETQRRTSCGRSVMPSVAAYATKHGNATSFRVRWIG